MKSLLPLAGMQLQLAGHGVNEYVVHNSVLKNFNLPPDITIDKPIFDMLCEDLFSEQPISSESDKDHMAKSQFTLQDSEYIT